MLSSNPQYGESKVIRLPSNGGTLHAGTITVESGKEYSTQQLEAKTIEVTQKIDYNAPQMHQAILDATNDIAQQAKSEDISQSPNNPDYFDLVMHYANESITQTRPTQDDAKRKEQILRVLDDDAPPQSSEEIHTHELGAQETEALGAVVCVYKAACLHKILQSHGFHDIYINEMEPKDGQEEGHTNVIATRPGSGAQEYDAGVVTPLPTPVPKAA